MVTELADAFGSLMAQRRSIRSFLADPVDDQILHSAFSMAQLAPSNCNVQPWAVHVVSGEAIERLRQRLVDRAAAGVPSAPDVPLTPPYPEPYRARQIEAAKKLFEATGIERHDIEGRQRSFLRNFEFFGAPHVAFVFMPEWAGLREAADIGIYTQSLMLALLTHGVASCAQGALGQYSDIVHEELDVPPELRLLFGISFGYPDAAHPANQVKTERLSLEDTVLFYS